ncbi:50S ribosomal protein L32e [Candidatus Woesearchaeota archaeon]|nr:50S ribosomal protein L32e [Candidatus Woesearchaeota archaeon]
MADLLELRKKINAKRPRFRHYDHQKRKEVGTRWRRPKGLHNKMRKGVWGKPATVNVGYRGPAAVRGLSSAGLVPVLVYAPAGLAKVDVKTQGVIIGSVGDRKRALLLKECKSKGVRVLNVKDVDSAVQMIDKRFAERRAEKKSRVARRSEKKAPKKEDKKEQKEVKTEEEQRREAERVLTKRE